MKTVRFVLRVGLAAGTPITVHQSLEIGTRPPRLVPTLAVTRRPLKSRAPAVAARAAQIVPARCAETTLVKSVKTAAIVAATAAMRALAVERQRQGILACFAAT